MPPAAVVPVSAPLPVDGDSSRIVAALRGMVRRGRRFRLRCLLGHEDTFAREPRRLRLRCTVCGRQTVGWAIGPGTAPVATSIPAAIRPRTATHDTSVGIGPWMVRRWQGRAEARERERQRQRLVAAAARAAETRAEERDPPPPAPPPVAQRVTGRLLAAEQPERWMNVARRVRAGLGG